MQQKEIDELKRELERKVATHQKLSTALTDLRAANDQLQVIIKSLLLLVCNPQYIDFVDRLHCPSSHTSLPAVAAQKAT